MPSNPAPPSAWRIRPDRPDGPGGPGGMTGRMSEPVAVVGMDVLLPGAGSVDAYWDNLVNGVDAISDVPSNRWDPEHYDPEHANNPNRFYCRRGGFIDELADFDPMQFGVMPASVNATEPEQLLALRVAGTALADAGGLDELPGRDRAAVILGRLGQTSMAGFNYYPRVVFADLICSLFKDMLPELPDDRFERIRQVIGKRLGPYSPENVIGLMPNLTASRVANRLDLHGPAYILDAACSSSLIALDHGIAGLLNGSLDIAVIGGVHHNHDATFWSVFTQLGALSRRGVIRPFDSAADGLLIGEGTAMVVLKRLSDAVRDGDRVHAVIRGIGISSDGRASSLVNPEVGGQVMAVRRAWHSAGLDPAEPGAIGLLEAHGTGTPTGDAAELDTVARVFGPPRDDERPVIGSVKSMIGHTMPTAGAASLIKAVLAVSRGMLLPTLHCDAPREEMAATRFAPIATARPWECEGPRRAAVNAFGFGGINAHVIVEQAPEAVRTRRRAQPPKTASAAVAEAEQIVLLAGPDAPAIARQLDAGDQDVRARGTALAARDAGAAGACRLGVVDPTPERLAAARKVVAAGTAWRGGRDIWFSPRPMLADGKGKIAFVFPGLEAELSGQEDDLVAHFGFESVKADTEDFSGRFIEVMRIGWMLHDALDRVGIKPDAIAGHSLGDWTAGLVAGLTDETSLGESAAFIFNPAFERKDLLHAVLSESADAVTAMLPGYPGVVLSIDNAPAQSVVCGPVEQVTRLIDDLSKQGKLCRPLPFTTGMHTPYVASYVEQLRPLVAHRKALRGEVPVWSTTIAAPLPDDLEERRELFFRHLMEPVLFRPTVSAMYEAGVRAFLQVGPGQLASLIGDSLRGQDHLAIPANVAFRSGLAQLRRVATALWAEGYAPDFAALNPAAGLTTASKPKPTANRSMRMRIDLGTKRFSLGDEAQGLITRDDFPGSAPRAKPRPARRAADGELVSKSVLRIDIETMPYLADHSFHQIPQMWPNIANAVPVVPAVTMIQHMIDAVEAATPGKRVIAVDDAQFTRWTLVVPAHEVEITVRRAGPDAFAVAFGSNVKATMRVAPGYPGSPPVNRPDPAGERPSPFTAERMYTTRIMFHGPRYRGVEEVLGLSDRHIRGRLRTPAPPGALLDSGLQIVGSWAHVTMRERKVFFPTGFGSIQFFGPAPAEGEALEVIVICHTVQDTQVLLDIQYIHEGRVWAQIKDCVSRRFDSHPRSRKVELDPGHHVFAERQPGGWVAVFDDWPDPASLNSIATLTLEEESYFAWQRVMIAHRRGWLLATLAVKDAVRYRMWADGGQRPIFPVEIKVSEGPGGRPRVTGWSGLDVPDYEISTANAGRVGVAIVRPASRGPSPDAPGLGIGAAEVAGGRRPGPAVPLSGDELPVLDAACRAVPGWGRAVWTARFAAAKEAAAKAAGLGADAPPAQAAVTAADADVITVAVAGRACPVSHREVKDPYEIAPTRRHMVAWTGGQEPATHQPGGPRA